MELERRSGKRELFREGLKLGEVLENPSAEELRELARGEELTTEFGSPAYITKVRSRSAKFTQIVYEEPTPEQAELIERVQAYLKGRKVIRVDRTMCQHPQAKLHCRLYVTAEFARLAYMWHEMLFPPEEPAGEPDLLTVDVPEWPERHVLVDPDSLTTYILGTDYAGEVKKSFLRMAMYVAKLRGGLGLHAGSKLIRVHDVNGKLVERGALFFGLSGTGKTTLTCHHHFLDDSRGEGVVIRQDDVVLLQPDASCYGTEENFYIKTEGLEPHDQPVLYRAAVSPNAILENVWVDPKTGRVDFLNYELTSNGRCLVRRRELAYTDEEIDLPRADLIIFITRRYDIAPPVARLTPEQAGAFFMLGESIETSAGDPTRAGLSLRVVGTNPFIIGSEAEEGDIFMRILRENPSSQCFVLNTGWVGGKGRGEKITVLDSTEIIKQLARGAVSWRVDPDWGYEVPEEIEGLDIERFDPRRFYSPREYRELVERLRQERREWLARFPGLEPAIANAIP